MNFPDHHNFLQLQKHLSQRPNLRPAVMVGAGISLNSKPSPGVRTRFPTWEKLSRAMFDEIYPLPLNATREKKEEREGIFNRSNAPRIASEYEAAFDRNQLNSFLLKSIPDNDHQPGDIHKLLLTLPWKDVFTTNYDTLLERAYVPERPYQTVQTINDLTTAESPRIIKLHGSFPSHMPFIITEEDYRTYPQCFAPFVNTVRQSLIENAFVLIGFSGNDPNFLEWIGWIRDELGDQHSPIYLVGLLSLTIIDRALLARRGVTPIDLSPVSVEIATTGNIHSAALEWFLRGLQAMGTPRPERWPESRTGEQLATGMDRLILVNQEVEPETVRSLVGSQNTFDETTAIKIMVRWRYERMKYPGWLIPTDEIRSSLKQKTDQYVPGLIQVAQDWSLVDRVLLYREILWRFETSLIPLDTSLMEPFETAVNDLFPALSDESRLMPSDNVTELLHVSEIEVPESWLELAFALLRDTRESYDPTRWDLFKDKISQLVHHYPQYRDRYFYEQALWFLWNLERDQAKNLLIRWSPSRNLPLAMMWKAGLLVELNDLSESRSLLRAALQEIRQSFYRTQGSNIDLLSLEGWCTYLLMPVESTTNLYNPIQDSQSQENNTNPTELREQFLERWDQLKAWDSDPWPLMEYFNKILSGESPATIKMKQVVPGFDIGHYSISHSLFEGPNTRWLPAFSYLRLHEKVGIPLQFSRDTLRNAAEWLAPFSDFWSLMILMRAGNTKAVQEGDFTNRAQIATMNPDLARRLNEWAMNALRRELSSLDDSIPKVSTQTSLLESLIEFLSRLSFKLELPDLQDAFRMALKIHSQSKVKTHIRLNKSCNSWFRRLFDAADNQQLLAWIPNLIRFPLPEENIDGKPLTHPAVSWPDPMSVFPCDRARTENNVDIDLNAQIHSAIEWLLRSTQTASVEVRQRALMRLILVFHTNLMTEEQERRLGNLLWEHTTEDGLPDLPDLILFNLLLLPAPAEIDSKSRLRNHLLTMKPQKSISFDGTSISVSLPGESEDQMILEVSSASKPVVQLLSEPPGKIEWDLTEKNQMWNEVYEWWENDKHVIKQSNHIPNFAAGFDGFARSSLERISMFLSRVVLPKMDAASEDEWIKILSFLSETRQDGVFLTAALPYILLHRPSEKDMVVESIRDDLSSDDERAVRAGAEAVSHWAYLDDEMDTEPLPPDVIGDLVKRIIFRRGEGASDCLQHLTLIITQKPVSLSLDQVNLIVSSLTPWRHATRIPIPENDSGGFPEHERPLLRALLGQLASALGAWQKDKLPDQPEPSEIAILRELYSSDPLPEARRSFENT